jgi:hypothetical protein
MDRRIDHAGSFLNRCRPCLERDVLVLHTRNRIDLLQTPAVQITIATSTGSAGALAGIDRQRQLIGSTGGGSGGFGGFWPGGGEWQVSE